MSPAPSETLAVVCPRCGAMADEPCVDERVTCVECGRVSREKGGWTARLTDDDEVVVYCPECDEREVDRA